jgi:hypothetical protein
MTTVNSAIEEYSSMLSKRVSLRKAIVMVYVLMRKEQFGVPGKIFEHHIWPIILYTFYLVGEDLELCALHQQGMSISRYSSLLS